MKGFLIGELIWNVQMPECYISSFEWSLKSLFLNCWFKKKKKREKETFLRSRSIRATQSITGDESLQLRENWFN